MNSSLLVAWYGNAGTQFVDNAISCRKRLAVHSLLQFAKATSGCFLSGLLKQIFSPRAMPSCLCKPLYIWAFMWLFGSHTIFADHQEYSLEPLDSYQSIFKGNFVFGVPNHVRFGGSIHSIRIRKNALMLTLGAGVNIGVATADEYAGFYRIYVGEQYANFGILPGMHWHSNGSNFVYALNAIGGMQISRITVDHPSMLKPGESVSYKIEGRQRDDLSFHLGAEAGIYYLVLPYFFGMEFGAVVTRRIELPYRLIEGGGQVDRSYMLPVVRNSGIRIALTVGAFF